MRETGMRETGMREAGMREAGEAKGDDATVAAGGAAEPIAVLRASRGRRLVGVGTLVGLAAVLGWIVRDMPATAPGLRIALVVLALGALWLARRVWVATAGSIVLTRAGLSDGAGREIAPLADITAVERGAFAFKPSNGFLVRLARPHRAGAAWAPGLWWRVGRRVGIGGITPAAPGKVMAEMLAALITERDADAGGRG